MPLLMPTKMAWQWNRGIQSVMGAVWRGRPGVRDLQGCGVDRGGAQAGGKARPQRGFGASSTPPRVWWYTVGRFGGASAADIQRIHDGAFNH